MSTLDAQRAYRVLGLAPGATPGEVKVAYRDLAQVWHPDRFRDNPRLLEKAARNLQRINDAYTVLKDYAPPPEPFRRPSRESLSSTLGLGDLRESAAFRAPAAAFRRSMRILRMSLPGESRPRSWRVLWWVLGLAAVAAIGALAAVFLFSP